LEKSVAHCVKLLYIYLLPQKTLQFILVSQAATCLPLQHCCLHEMSHWLLCCYYYKFRDPRSDSGEASKQHRPKVWNVCYGW